MRETRRGLELDRDDLVALAERAECLVALLEGLPDDMELSLDELDLLCAETVRRHPDRRPKTG